MLTSFALQSRSYIFLLPFLRRRVVHFSGVHLRVRIPREERSMPKGVLAKRKMQSFANPVLLGNAHPVGGLAKKM